MKETLQCVGWPFRPPASHFSKKLTALRDSLIRFHLSHTAGAHVSEVSQENSQKRIALIQSSKCAETEPCDAFCGIICNYIKHFMVII